MTNIDATSNMTSLLKPQNRQEERSETHLCSGYICRSIEMIWSTLIYCSVLIRWSVSDDLLKHNDIVWRLKARNSVQSSEHASLSRSIKSYLLGKLSTIVDDFSRKDLNCTVNQLEDEYMSYPFGFGWIKQLIISLVLAKQHNGQHYKKG